MGCGSSVDSQEHRSPETYKSPPESPESSKKLKLTKNTLGKREQSPPRLSSPVGEKDLGQLTLQKLNHINGDVNASYAKGTDSEFLAEDDSASQAYSEAESNMTAESFFEVLGRKVNRPRSAKGHSVEQPTPEGMQQRIYAMVLRGSLEGIDASVEPSEMIRESNWTRWLCSRLAHPKGKNVLEDCGGIVPIVSPEEDYSDLLTVITSGSENGQHPTAVAGGVSDDDEDGNMSDIGDATAKDVKLETMIANGRVSTTLSGDVSGPKTLRHIGQFHFRNRRLRNYYARVVKPWVLDYLYGREAVDTALSPVADSVLPCSPRTASEQWTDAFNKSIAQQSATGSNGVSTSPVTKPHPMQLAEDDVLKMML